LGFGTNIGNTLENTMTWETGWGEPLITQTFISGLASRGIKTVRVPVAWDTYANNGVIDAAKMDRVKEVVSWINTTGMYAIVNIPLGWRVDQQRKGLAAVLADERDQKQILELLAADRRRIQRRRSAVDPRGDE